MSKNLNGLGLRKQATSVLKSLKTLVNFESEDSFGSDDSAEMTNLSAEATDEQTKDKGVPKVARSGTKNLSPDRKLDTKFRKRAQSIRVGLPTPAEHHENAGGFVSAIFDEIDSHQQLLFGVQPAVEEEDYCSSEGDEDTFEV